MRRYCFGSDGGGAAATTAAGGLLAPVIPPSMMFVIFGVLAQVPIGEMFIAGILPGLLLVLAFAAVITLIGWSQHFPKGDWMSAAQIRGAVLAALPALLVPLAIIGGILFGIATPTESRGDSTITTPIIPSATADNRNARTCSLRNIAAKITTKIGAA